MKTFIIEGKEINSISDFYGQINKLFMQNETWRIGESLDALDDLLYRDFGSATDEDKIKIIWKDSSLSKEALGLQTTKDFYKRKTFPNSPYNQKFVERKLKELEDGVGQTYFEIVVEIFKSHANTEFHLE